jgi:iron complex outermembrane recepter protein
MSYDMHGKMTYSNGAHRVQVVANHFRSQQQTEYTTDPTVNQQPPGEAKAVTMEGLRLDRRIGSRNTVASADYWHADLAGGSLHTQIFFRDYMTRFQPFDGRPWAAYGAIVQSYLESQKAGARLEYERRLPGDIQVLGGLDLTAENTQQPVYIIDPDAYDASGGLTFHVVGEQPWVPLMKPRQAGLFGLVSGSPFTWLDLQGGIRYERARLNIDDFTTLAGNRVNGGSLAYDPVLFNAGAVVHTSSATRLFASFSQGFSLTDIGLYLRSAPDGFTVGNRTLEAQTVNNVELGAGLNTRPVRASLTGFYNQSDLGTTSAGLDMAVVRAPERVYGIEATLDTRPSNVLRLGGTFTWTEGENDVDEDGEYLPLNTFRIQPLKLTAYGEYDVMEGWTNRLQLLFSGERTRAYEQRANPDVVLFGERPVGSYVVVDLISTIQTGPGTLRLGVENLLNSQYFPVVSQLMYNGGNSSRAAAPGIQLRVGYSVTY